MNAKSQLIILRRLVPPGITYKTENKTDGKEPLHTIRPDSKCMHIYPGSKYALKEISCSLKGKHQPHTMSRVTCSAQCSR